ncbi:hypothetical protein [Sporichthya sp.]|uniref:hypothetical protein n=1 Tax=Sporichthya sp. TaxID=65475 RepID=UPI0017BE84E9|nr:hypothetical protein [Sporichthya sp.]MBA3744414.1 hypothetical protein [Sporichthya sp.]
MSEKTPTPAAADPVPAASHAAAVRRERRGRLGPVARPVPLLALALAASLLWSVWLGLQVRSDHRDSSERREALAAAESFATTLSSYDHTRLEQDFAAVMANSTGSFKSEYTVASEALRTLITKLHGTASGKVLNAGLVSYGNGEAQVILFVDQTVTNDSTKQPRLDRTRMRLGLEKQDGRWLISSLDLL